MRMFPALPTPPAGVRGVSWQALLSALLELRDRAGIGSTTLRGL